MGGLLSFLSPALTTATQAAGAYQGAQAQGHERDMANVLQQVQLKRQQEQDALKLAVQQRAMQSQGLHDQLIQAQTSDAQRRARVPIEGDPQWEAARVSEALRKQQAAEALRRQQHKDRMEEIGVQQQGANNRTAMVANRARAPKAPTQSERQAGALLPEVEDAERQIASVSPDVLTEVYGGLPLVGEYLRSDKGRNFEQLANQFITNGIYLKSGRTVNEGEARRLWKTYIPHPSDGPSTLAQKAKARKLLLQGAHISAGRADPGTSAATPDDADDPAASILSRYNDLELE